MKIENLSEKYRVKRIEETDIPEVYALCKSNPLYYQHCPPNVTISSVKEELTVLPKGKKLEDKYYLGFYHSELLVAVIDLISGYPNGETVFIGFFMIDQHIQKKGIGTSIISEVCRYLKKIGFTYVRLGYIKGNPQSEAFWTKNHFIKTGEEVQTDSYVIVVMQRTL
ncbi:GNAT family N-acetyltransferase [Lacrimispora saccharolytica]|uniref:GCN5-related N-acetyltransferase n=1 Tax=Lacrimispora saccharolytica (strain ATCC 35040 / DSM 2544 / NRCC 2533 / WM1) TaxID=610130 RepID=D9R989_LACSW|nr:GNAT family N-acetyltransferase [Lacrimispora saccharolytica]ADL05840.1 GCN5-related N-acetyltransferase [[Clostridium] saccharolyticum WM1]QRV20030.1 GNAT family N-acetyltransferase [Lacrimispora saccharolytica]